jgi:hypothetical protein
LYVSLYVQFISQCGQAHAPEDHVGELVVLRGVCGHQLFAKEQPDNNYVLVKADNLVRTAGTPLPPN